MESRDVKDQRRGLPKRVHMIAVCGTGMGPLALLLRESGVSVSGSDLQAYPPMGDMLRKAGVEISLGYRSENVPDDAEYVVIGNAVSRDNPEVETVQNRGVPYGSLPETLSRFFLGERTPVVVVGTHGKTTSSALLAWMLESAGMSPGFLVGGEPNNFGSSSRVGNGPCFVIEGDEYDSAFFDKKPKFLRYQPQVALFTSLEYDHADIYPDLASLKKEFLHFVRLLPRDGLLMVCDEYKDALDIAGEAVCTVETYGYREDSHWRGVLREEGTRGVTLEVIRQGALIGAFDFPMAGRHNALNLLGCLGILTHLGVSSESLGIGLSEFKGVRRRQEILGEEAGVLLMIDFAHHPTAVRETINAIRSRFSERRILTVFEPRTHTSRRNIFQDEYVEAFMGSELSICTKVFRSETVPPMERFSPEAWVDGLRNRGKDAHYIEDTEDLILFLGRECREGDLVLFMSSGDLVSVIDELCNKLKGNS